MRAPFHVASVAFSLVAGCAAQSAARPATPRFVAAAAPFYIGPMAGLPETGDFNGDGHLDLAVACGPCCGGEPSPDAGHVQILLGDGAGRLRAASDPTPIGETALRVAVGDVNEDGELDVLCSQHSSFDVTACFGDGQGALEVRKDRPAVTLNEGGRPHVHSISTSRAAALAGSNSRCYSAVAMDRSPAACP